MNGIGGWLKKRWLIVLSVIVTLAAPPAMIFVSAGMNKSLRDEMQKKVDSAYNGVTKSTVNLTIPDIAPNTSQIEETATVNESLIRWFGNERQQFGQEVTRIEKAAIEFNRNNHELLISELFPKPPDRDLKLLAREFVQRIVDRTMKAMLDSIGAGGKPDPAALALQLRDFDNGERQRLMTNSGSDTLTDEQEDQLVDQLRKIREGWYQLHASRIDVFADRSIFIGLPAELPTSAPTLEECWDWQEQLWIYGDIFRAIASANENVQRRTGQKGVPGSVVKRILTITAEGARSQSSGDGGAVMMGGGGPVFGGDFEQGGGASANTITGRADTPEYDTRTATLEAIVDPQHLPALFNALSTTNFMTIIDCDLVHANASDHLREGYSYGASPVVVATIVIETVWLTEWVNEFKPESLKNAAAGAGPVAQPGRSPGREPRRDPRTRRDPRDDR